MKSNDLLPILQRAKSKLIKSNITNAKNELEWFVQKKFNIQKKYIYLQKHIYLTRKQVTQLNDFLKRRLSGEPFQYILNMAPFYGYDLYVNKNVLIPRPETELMIDILIKANRKYHKAIDLCTGSGNLALMLSILNIAKNITALDISKKALNVAKKNFKTFKTTNITSQQHNLLINSPREKYDLAVCNPPYVSLKEYCTLENKIKEFEPKIALTDEKNGLTFYKMLSKNLNNIIKPKGTMLIEIGLEKNKTSIEQMFNKHTYTWHKDLNQDYRVIQIFK